MHSALSTYLRDLPRVGEPPAALTSVRAVPEEVEPGSLFVALREPPDFDGHMLLEEARRWGAAAAVIEAAWAREHPDPPLPAWVVASTTRTFGDLARIYREHFLRYPIVAITGSAGKTSTKEWAAAALDAVATEGNRNNLHGAPYTLLGFPRTAAAGIVEIGTSLPGEIRRLSEIVNPDVGVLTGIGHTHLSGLGDVDGVAREKGDLLATLAPSSVAVVNADDPRALAQLARFRGSRVLLFSAGAHRRAQVRLRSVQDVSVAGVRACFEIEGRDLELSLAQPGVHNLYNVAAALAVALALDVDLELAAMRLESTRPLEGRFAANVLAGRTIIDDSYNANPEAVRAAVRSLIRLAGQRPTLLCLGDMAELGPRADELHRELGRWLAGSGLAKVFGVGELVRSTIDAATEDGRLDARHFGSREALVESVLEQAEPGDFILVKGSRSSSMDRVVDGLGRAWGA